MSDIKNVWELSFQIESILLNISRSDSVAPEVVALLDKKVEQFNSSYSTLKFNIPAMTGVESPSVETESIISELIIPVEDSVIEIEEQPAIIADKPEIESEVVMLNEEISSHNNPEPVIDEVVMDPSAEHKDKNLQHLFTLNDRFLFSRELFGGSKEQYGQALQLIENMPDYITAKEYLIDELGWDEEDSTVQAFLEIINRYFQ